MSQRDIFLCTVISISQCVRNCASAIRGSGLPCDVAHHLRHCLHLYAQAAQHRQSSALIAAITEPTTIQIDTKTHIITSKLPPARSRRGRRSPARQIQRSRVPPFRSTARQDELTPYKARVEKKAHGRPSLSPRPRPGPRFALPTRRNNPMKYLNAQESQKETLRNAKTTSPTRTHCFTSRKR